MFALLSLPVEIRDMIYSYILPKKEIRCLNGIPSLPILQVCHDLRSDVIYILPTRCTFHVSSTIELSRLYKSFEALHLGDLSKPLPRRLCIRLFKHLSKYKSHENAFGYKTTMFYGTAQAKMKKELEEWMKSIRNIPKEQLQHITIDTTVWEQYPMERLVEDNSLVTKFYNRVERFVFMKTGGKAKCTRHFGEYANMWVPGYGRSIPWSGHHS